MLATHKETKQKRAVKVRRLERALRMLCSVASRAQGLTPPFLPSVCPPAQVISKSKFSRASDKKLHFQELRNEIEVMRKVRAGQTGGDRGIESSSRQPKPDERPGLGIADIRRSCVLRCVPPSPSDGSSEHHQDARCVRERQRALHCHGWSAKREHSETQRAAAVPSD